MSMHESSRRAPRSALSALSHIAEMPTDGAGSGTDDAETHEQEVLDPESPKEIKERLISWIDETNLAKHLDENTLATIGQLVVREYEIDETSRAEWKSQADMALDFATQTAEEKQYPWPNASNVIFPLITSAALMFNARAYGAIIPNRNVVKGIVWGDDKGTPATEDGKEGGRPIIDAQSQPVWKIPPGEKTRRAERVGEHMSWQLLEEIAEWETQTDNMLMQLPIVGGAIRKTFRDDREECNSSVLVPITKMVWSFTAPSFEKAPRHTEIMELYPHEIDELEREDETFLAMPYGPGDSGDEDGANDQTDSQAPHTFLEQHRRYDLDGDGYPEPLIITVHKRSGKVVRIVARYEEEGIITDEKTGRLKRIVPIDSYTLYPFLPNPKGGSYPVGFGHLLKPLNEAINTTLNQMFDAGHLQIAGGGFIGTGFNLHAGPTMFSIGEFKPVNNKGANIRDSVFPMPWPGPSAVLFQLLGFLVQAAKEVASIQDVLTGDASIANAPPTTVLALIEQGTKVYTAIHKRIYRALKSEFAKLYRLNRIYLVEDERYRVGDTWRTVTAEDYRLGGGVEPVADPTQVTDMQRLGRAMVLKEAAKDNPLINPLEATRRYLEAAQIDRIGDLLPDKMPPPQPGPDAQKMQIEQQKLQLQMQELQAGMGEKRAHELQLYTQAILNFEKAQASAKGGTLQWIENQLEMMRIHVEALNTTIKAAQVDATVHGHEVARHGHELAHRGRMADIAQRAREVAHERPDGTGGQDPGDTEDTGPSDADPGAAGPAGIPQPPDAGDLGDGVPGVAPQPGLSGIPALPGP